MIETVYRTLSPMIALIIAFCASAGLLVGAHLFERLGNLAPCLLCLDQREVHWVAAGVSLLAFTLTKITKSARLLAASLSGLAIIYAFSAWLAGFHTGVEWGFWPGPAACAAGGGAAPEAISGLDILASLDAPGPANPSCSEAAWRMFGISMAGYNAIISVGLASISAISCYTAWNFDFPEKAKRPTVKTT